MKLPLFVDSDTGKQVKLSALRRYLAKKVKKVDISPQNIPGHSLRIGRATAYANPASSGATTAGF